MPSFWYDRFRGGNQNEHPHPMHRLASEWCPLLHKELPIIANAMLGILVQIT